MCYCSRGDFVLDLDSFLRLPLVVSNRKKFLNLFWRVLGHLFLLKIFLNRSSKKCNAMDTEQTLLIVDEHGQRERTSSTEGNRATNSSISPLSDSIGPVITEELKSLNKKTGDLEKRMDTMSGDIHVLVNLIKLSLVR